MIVLRTTPANVVIPAKAGIYPSMAFSADRWLGWMAASAAMTKVGREVAR